MGWPNVVQPVLVHLRTAVSGRVSTRLPADLAGDLPVTRVRRGPGADDGRTDTLVVDVETFTAAGDEDLAWQHADAVRAAMHDLSGRSVDGVLIDSVTTSSGPTDVDYENPAVTRYVAAYTVALRRTH